MAPYRDPWSIIANASKEDDDDDDDEDEDDDYEDDAPPVFTAMIGPLVGHACYLFHGLQPSWADVHHPTAVDCDQIIMIK